MGSGGKLDPALVQVTDIAKTYNCPLATMVRKHLHKLGLYTGFKAVFSPEKVRPSAMYEDPSQNHRTTIGTISYMPALFGCHCASVVIRDLIDNNAK
jgi:tRNA A37 threonylcarbamoyladenosine dehydratase